MNRQEMIKTIENNPTPWDLIIIGGGATGLGAGVDAASRGYRTLLLEQSDFAKGTSSRSTKLIHGGLRYLQQGNVALVIEALRERGRLCANAPHLIHHLPFLVPNYHWWEGPFYGIGLKIYDLLAGKLGIENSRHLSREETLKAIPTLASKGLRGGTVYYDGQFDDARLAITLAQTMHEHGGTLLNYMPVTGLIKENGLITGVKVHDKETNKRYKLHARAVINATGVFADRIRLLDNPEATELITPSQGVHLVLNASFQPGKTAILVPHTEDKRVLFLVPWHGRVLVGTTDTPMDNTALEPKPLKEEIEFLLKHAAKYLSKIPTKKDILSIYAGLRPLIKHESTENTAAISRDHSIIVDPSGLITIAGGKWTTYRKMGEDVVNKAALIAGLPEKPCITHTLRLHGWKKISPLNHWSTYGKNSTHLRALMRADASLAELLHPRLPYYTVEVLWAVRKEMARTLEDVLARRTRSLLLDAQASLEIAPKVARLIAQELGYPAEWEKEQLAAYVKLAKTYLPPQKKTLKIPSSEPKEKKARLKKNRGL